MTDDDPITADERQLGHLYLLAQPETAAEEALVELLARDDAMRVLQEIVGLIVRERGGNTTRFEPDLHQPYDRVPPVPRGWRSPPTAPRTAPAGSRRCWSW